MVLLCVHTLSGDDSRVCGDLFSVALDGLSAGPNKRKRWAALRFVAMRNETEWHDIYMIAAKVVRQRGAGETAERPNCGS